MDTSVSLEDRIWFLHVCHHIPFSLYQQISPDVLFPGVDVDSVTGKVFWANQAGDFPFVGMDTNGCSFTTCPIVAGNRQSYVYQLSISKKFPVVSGGVRL